MRKRIGISLAAALLALMVLTSAAVGAVAQSAVFDETGLFTADEATLLEQSLQELNEARGVTFMIAVVEDAGEEITAYADSFYEAHAGAKDGGILLIDKNNERVSISAYGTVWEKTGDRLQMVLDEVLAILSERQYYDAADEYVKLMDVLLGVGAYDLLPDGEDSAAPERANNELVYDGAGLFSGDEALDLAQRLRQFNQTYNVQMIIATTNNADGKSAKQYAMDFYDEHVGAKDGGILLIDMDNREVFIDASGALWMHVDGRIDPILDRVAPHLTNKNYYKAAGNFITEAEKYMNTEPLPLKSDLKPGAGDVAVVCAVAVLLGVIVFFIGYFGVKKKYSIHNTKAVYPLQERSTLELTAQEDVLVNTTHTSRTIQSSSSSGSSRSSRSSSRSRSGGSRGGGGRKF